MDRFCVRHSFNRCISGLSIRQRRIVLIFDRATHAELIGQSRLALTYPQLPAANQTVLARTTRML